MRKIADTAELSSELRRLIAYTQTDAPSRSKIARALEDLGMRLASGGDSFMSHKTEWALELANLMAKRFSDTGGWRDHHIRSQINRTQYGAELYLESPLGWNCGVTINVEGAGHVETHFSVPKQHGGPVGVPIPDNLPDLDNIDLESLLGDIKRGTFPIKDREPQAKLMMDVSLWLSKQLTH